MYYINMVFVVLLNFRSSTVFSVTMGPCLQRPAGPPQVGGGPWRWGPLALGRCWEPVRTALMVPDLISGTCLCRRLNHMSKFTVTLWQHTGGHGRCVL